MVPQTAEVDKELFTKAGFVALAEGSWYNSKTNVFFDGKAFFVIPSSDPSTQDGAAASTTTSSSGGAAPDLTSLRQTHTQLRLDDTTTDRLGFAADFTFMQGRRPKQEDRHLIVRDLKHTARCIFGQPKAPSPAPADEIVVVKNVGQEESKKLAETKNDDDLIKIKDTSSRETDTNGARRPSGGGPENGGAEESRRLSSASGDSKKPKERGEDATEQDPLPAKKEHEGRNANPDASPPAAPLPPPGPLDHFPSPCALFGVFDGHQGAVCSEQIAKRFVLRLVPELASYQGDWSDQRIRAALARVCEALDAEFLAKFRTVPDGATAVVSLLLGTRLVTLWVGDSRAVMMRKVTAEEQQEVGEDKEPGKEGDEKSKDHSTNNSKGARPYFRCEPLTKDHNAEDKREQERVKRAGGKIIDLGGCMRVAHQDFEEKARRMKKQRQLGLSGQEREPVALAVSRSFGDRDFKIKSKNTPAPLIIATPDVSIRSVNPGDAVLLSCDGVFDVLSNEEVVRMLSKFSASSEGPRSACAAIVNEAFRRKSQDNLTCIAVYFQKAEDEEEKRKKALREEEKSKAAEGARPSSTSPKKPETQRTQRTTQRVAAENFLFSKSAQRSAREREDGASGTQKRERLTVNLVEEENSPKRMRRDEEYEDRTR